MTRSLRVKFVLALTGLVALVLLANGLVQALSWRSELRKDIERRALAFAELAVGPVCEAYETYYASGYSKFRELLSEIVRLNPDLERLEIYDTGGSLLFDSRELQREVLTPGPPHAPPPAAASASSALQPALRGMTVVSFGAVDERGGEVFTVVSPFVEGWGRHRYSIAFHVGYAGLRQSARAAFWRIFWLSIASLGLGVLFAVALSRQSLGPLEVLTRGARDLAEGRLDRRIDLRSGDEFGTLAATFNQMAGRLSGTISDLEASNRALGQMNLELQQLDRMKSDLLANVSHELRTPLTAIQGYTEAMDEGLLGLVNPQQADAFKVVRRNTQRLLGMIEQLLSFSRLDAGSARPQLAAFDLTDVARQVVSSVRAGRGPGLNLELDAEDGLPPAWGDAGRIAQVLENLVTNAAKFTPPGAAVRVRLRRAGNEVEAEVADRGIGIAKAHLPKIFERFYQADTSSTRRYGGMGLGLAIVSEILAAHQRQIEVESEEGRGSTFRFRLPMAPVPPVPRQAAGETGPPGGAWPA